MHTTFKKNVNAYKHRAFSFKSYLTNTIL